MAEDLVDPPTFHLPSGFGDAHNNSDYEVWSLRTPVLFDPASLDGIALSFNNDILSDQSQTKHKYGAGDNVVSSFELSNDTNDRYSIVLGHTSETKSFRVLLPTKPTPDSDTDQNDDDEHEDQKKNMKLHSAPFTRHVNLIRSSRVEMTEFHTAPSKELAPEPRITATARTGDSKQNAGLRMVMREAYSHVAQVKGLKRRWNISGSNVDVGAAQERHKRRTQTGHGETQRQQTRTEKQDAVMNAPDDGSDTINQTPAPSDEKGSTAVEESTSAKKSKKTKKASEKKKRRKSEKGSSSTKKELKKSKKKKHRSSSKTPTKLE